MNSVKPLLQFQLSMIVAESRGTSPSVIQLELFSKMLDELHTIMVSMLDGRILFMKITNKLMS